MTFAEDGIYAVGGTCGYGPTFALNTAEVLNVGADSWRKLVSMQNRRYDHGIAVLEGELFVAGGHSDSSALSTMEHYDVNSNEWQSAASMNIPRQGLGLASLGQLLYAVGGHRYGGSSEAGQLRSGESYDAVVDKWIGIAPMARLRMDFGLTALGRCLYAVGRSTVERYDPRGDQWETISNTNGTSGVVYNSATNIGDRIFALGYKCGQTFVSFFDPVGNRWENAKEPPGSWYRSALTWCPRGYADE